MNSEFGGASRATGMVKSAPGVALLLGVFYLYKSKLTYTRNASLRTACLSNMLFFETDALAPDVVANVNALGFRHQFRTTAIADTHAKNIKMGEVLRGNL